jgi:glycosyltransferase involved in cell wall biosynthesis
MKISILIATLNNINYLKILINSIIKNSTLNHEIIVHVNENNDRTIDFLKSKNIKYSFSNHNIGLCSSINKAYELSTNEFLLYSHDDMYFLPKWDSILSSEVNKLNTNNFYLSGTMIQKEGADLKLNCGETYLDFDEKFLLENYKKINIHDHQGSHWAPHLIHRSIWERVGGFSETFNPGDGSDSDFNMKLWKDGVKIFKGINDFKVYHFGSISMRKKKDIVKNNGAKTFLKKWGITTKFFFKHYLKTGSIYDGPLKEPDKNFLFLIGLFICKIKKIFI